MAQMINLGGLKRFMTRLDRCSALLNNFHAAMELICKEAQRYAEEQYAQYGRTDVTVSYDNNGTLATIYANGTQVAFYEFGTGRVGDGTYSGILPSSGVPITDEWKYYYPNEATKRTSNGVEGWFHAGTFQRGIRAEEEMWKTSQFITLQAHFIIKAYFKFGSGGI